MQLLDYFKEERRKEKILELEGGSSRSHSLENSLWKHILTCCERDYVMNVGKLVSHFEDTNQKISPGTAVSTGSKQKES
jgi:predicted DNA-binding ribbon-helix-helix protein